MATVCVVVKKIKLDKLKRPYVRAQDREGQIFLIYERRDVRKSLMTKEIVGKTVTFVGSIGSMPPDDDGFVTYKLYARDIASVQ